MKKLKWLTPILIMSLLFGMVACKHSTNAPDPHHHTFAEDWTRDETYHWHASTCGHDVTEGKAEHSFGIWEITKDPTETESGKMESVCEVCGESVTKEIQVPEDFRFVKGDTISGTETWTPTSKVFVSGRSLTIPNLFVSDHEVTRGEYKAVMGSDPSTAKAYDENGTELTGDDVLNNPVNCVNWYNAIVYCNKLSKKEGLTECYSINGETDPDKWGTVPTTQRAEAWDVTCNFEANGYRLPTEAEWEWFARGGENYDFAGSGTLDDVAWHRDITTGTRKVKTKDPNGYGLYDMSGNVNEWCWDRYVYNIDVSTGEYGVASGNSRVKRGGSWDNTATYCQVYYHGLSQDPYLSYDDCGFRVVRTIN